MLPVSVGYHPFGIVATNVTITIALMKLTP